MMEYELIILFKRYQEKIIHAKRCNFPDKDKCSKEHLIDLCYTAMKRLSQNKMSYGKACRWLGFIQGILCASGLTTVDYERDFTRPIFQGEPK